MAPVGYTCKLSYSEYLQAIVDTVAHYNNVYHPYHLVDPSPWPLVGALGAFMATSGGVMYFHNNQPYGMVIGFIIIACTMVVW